MRFEFAPTDDPYLASAEALQSIAHDLNRIAGEIEARHLCEICRERPSETLTGDGHPEGVNLLVCAGCAR